MNLEQIVEALEIEPALTGGGSLVSTSPIDGVCLAALEPDGPAAIEAKLASAQEAFLTWRTEPAPRRGELVRLFGEELRRAKDALGALVTLECGKIRSEGLGEVQEMIDICDFAVGLSRQLYGLSIASERPGHRMAEYWHPAGPVGIISAFNFPVAVWAWNAALALVCGDSIIWKPSDKAPLCALAANALLLRAIRRFGDAPEGLSSVILGDAQAARAVAADSRMAVVSATGSTQMGREIGGIIANRFGRAILELGGNNAVVVAPSADLDLALRGILFGAVGTAGQRCTTTRRLIVHEEVADTLVARLKTAYASLVIGDPRDSATLVGPLIDARALEAMDRALEAARATGAQVTGGGRTLAERYPDAYYAQPALVEMPSGAPQVQAETFAPILYVHSYRAFDDAIALQNAVPQGLSSAIFTNDVREAERFASATGSDCGIANVNLGTSGAEIGGAFGGEKETGGGRESGSDSWKAYMRRMTSTVNWSRELPLAQGVRFGQE